jgi:hypothetical protein
MGAPLPHNPRECFFLTTLYSRSQANLDSGPGLIAIDLLLYPTSEGKKELARTLITAVHENGSSTSKNSTSPRVISTPSSLLAAIFKIFHSRRSKSTPPKDSTKENPIAMFQPTEECTYQISLLLTAHKKPGLRDYVEMHQTPKFTPL